MAFVLSMSTAVTPCAGDPELSWEMTQGYQGYV